MAIGPTVSEGTARGVRTAIQGSPVYLALEFLEAFEIYDFTDRQWGISLLAGTAIVSFIQNKLENRRGKGFFLRDVQSPPEETPVEGA